MNKKLQKCVCCFFLSFVAACGLTFTAPLFAEATDAPESAAESTAEPAAESTAEPAKNTESSEPADVSNSAPAETASTDAAGSSDADSADAATSAEAVNSAVSDEKKPLTAYELVMSGGVLMYPIGFMSLLVIAVGLERLFALRRGAVLPRRLFHNVDVQVSAKADPRAIYAACRRNRSASSKVIQAALMMTGRPLSEVLAVIQNAKDNEATRLFGKVRILVLAAAITPLMGLLGTVMGMIQAFMATASSVGVHKAELLSEGIYMALVTTCAGLFVAIPAAILAHWYEGKIQKLFYKMDEKLLNFISYMEALEGKVHVTPAQFEAYLHQKAGKTSK